MTEQTPTRIDFAPGVYGEDYKTQEKYLGIVYSQSEGPGPTCFYEEGTKTYTVNSGEVDGVFVQGEYVVYELDLRDLDRPISDLKDNGLLREIIEKRKEEIRIKKLELGKKYKIPSGILHQPVGKGILRIEVNKGYFPEKVIENNEIDLSCLVDSNSE